MGTLTRHAVGLCLPCDIGKVRVEASIRARPTSGKSGFSLIRVNPVEVWRKKLINRAMELLKEKGLQNVVSSC